MTGAGLASLTPAVRAQSEDRTSLEARIARVVREFELQGHHRTGTKVDRDSAEWLGGIVDQAGLTPSVDAFGLSRVDPVSAVVIAGDRRFEGLPLFDGAFTTQAGITGRLGALDAGTEVGLSSTAPNASAAGALGGARRANRHKAIVCVTNGQRPGLCPSNADLFLRPFGPPVLQVSSAEGAALADLARQNAPVTVVAQVARTPATALNVTTKIVGADPSLPPLVIMTPRSGWYTCAGERGGGIVCWLELMRTLKNPRPARDILFVASSGHELGHLGINAFVDARPGIVRRSVAWMHFGANIGAAVEPGNNVQASDDEMEGKLAQAMTSVGLKVDRRVPRGTVPGGEAEVVHRGGGRYVSVIGRSALFHNPEDRGPRATDPRAIALFIDAFTAVARTLSA